MNTQAASVLDIRSVTKRYRERTAVNAASLSVARAEIVCLLGPSGCGKSTMLRLAAGLEPVDAGEIAIEGVVQSRQGQTAPPEKRGVGIVFQDFALFPHMTVMENVLFGIAKLDPVERRARAVSLLEMFRMQDRADAYPHMLSGGEQQRVAIARSLARRPAAILLDEPFSGLDGHLKGEVRRTVLEGLREAGASVLVVTHDPEEAMLMADRLALMSEGRILQVGAARECYLRPVSVAAARLLGEANVIRTQIAGGVARTVFGDLPASGMPEGEAFAMFRPEAFSFADHGVSIEVLDVRFAGAQHDIEISSGGVKARMRLAGGTPPPLGPARVRVDIDRACVLPFD